jgi:general secretion pathway protein G
MRRARPGGFTLIELMVVVVILGILATVVFTRLNARESVDRARRAAIVAQLSTIHDAVQLFSLREGRLPASLDEVAPEIERGLVPLDPWKRPYLLRVLDPPARKFEIACLGADGEPGGEGDNADLTSLAVGR